MESVRRCKECRRIIHGAAGDACPYCGSGKLVTVSLPPQQRQFASVLTLVLTFCVGLVGLRMVLAALGLRASISSGASGALWNLELIIVLSTVLYLLLRRGEGDFRALFVVAFGLFACSEGLSALARSYGLAALGGLSLLFSQAMMVYAALALSAAVTEGWLKDIYHRKLVGISVGFMALGICHILLEIFSRENEKAQNEILLAALLGIAAYAVILLLLAERKKSQPGAGHAESAKSGSSGLLQATPPEHGPETE